jgi:hypothetical protein
MNFTRPSLRAKAALPVVAALAALATWAAAGDAGADTNEGPDGVPARGDLQARCTSAPGGSRWAAGTYARRAVFGQDPNGWLQGPSGLAATRDGRVAVLDGAASRIVVLDSALRQVREIGRRGRGPGELAPNALLRLQRPRRIFNYLEATDSALFAYDTDGVEVFGWDGRFRRHIGGVRGRVLLPHTLRALSAGPRELLYGFDSLDANRSRHRLQTWTVAGERRRLVAELRLPPLPGPNGSYVGSRQARALWAARGDCVVMADGGSEWVLRLHRAAGRADTLRLPPHRVPRYRASDDAEGREHADLLRGRVQGYRGTEGVMEPTLLIRWTEMAIDPDGYLWLRPWRSPSESDRPVPVVRVSLQTGRAEHDTVPAFPHAFGPPGVYYSLEKDPDTDEAIVAKYDRRGPARR